MKNKNMKDTGGIKKEKSFEKKMLDAGAVPNLVAGLVTIVYIATLSGLDKEKCIPAILFALGLTFVLNFIVAPLTNRIITHRLSEDLYEWEHYTTTERECTGLLKRIMACPQYISFQVFLVFGGGAVFWVSTFDWLFHFQKGSISLSLYGCAMGAFTAAVLAMVRAQKLCSSYGCRIVAQGIDREEIKRRHTFGLSSVYMVLFHIIIPMFLINGISLLIAWKASDLCGFSNEFNLIQVVILSVFNILYLIGFTLLIYNRMMNSIDEMRKMLETMDDGNMHNIKTVPTDLSNEFMYNIYLANSIIELLQNILKFSAEISAQVVEAGSELSVVSKETAVTSLEQSSGIKELLTAMEESDKLSREIAVKIGEVAVVARKTTQDVGDGFDVLKQNMHKLDEIRVANETTLNGIKTLGEKISGISDIALMINSIADQTNIIAFNAEIEASSAGDAGKNFYIVASEIRRLTNSTIESTKEIRNKIIEIQHSSEELLHTSKNGSVRISEGEKIAGELHTNFEDIKASSESADVASEDIKKIIQSQTAAFEQIVVTLRQIAAGAEGFSESTQTINNSAEKLCSEAEQLEKIQPEIKTGEN